MEIGAWKFELQSCARIFMVATVPLQLSGTYMDNTRICGFKNTKTFGFLFNEMSYYSITCKVLPKIVRRHVNIIDMKC